MRNVYSVSQINRYIKNMFAEDYLLRSVLVRGEVSNCKYHSSGHIYFTLKDASGTLSCIMFAGRRRGLSFRMKEGDQVIVAGTVDVYERDGRYQLYADQIRLDGVGELNARYEELKRRLEESGMFDEIYKKPIPRYIHTLGVVTAPTGAAVRDIINISLRRDPYLQIILYPALVQGDAAPASIVRGIQVLQQTDVDTIIIGRGGGSLEDLWAFNDERVAEAVFACDIPVISAVGHETDTVITDYVADLRAPTPSAAAELAVFEYAQFQQDLENYAQGLLQRMNNRLGTFRDRAESCRRELQHLSPSARIRDRRMLAARSAERLQEIMNRRISEARRQADRMQQLQSGMDRRISEARGKADQTERLQGRMDRILRRSRQDMQLLAARLEQRSPVARLSGGYGFVSDSEGRAVTEAAQVREGDLLLIRMRDGSIEARAEKISKQESIIQNPGALNSCSGEKNGIVRENYGK